jgi:hypothetical protein
VNTDAELRHFDELLSALLAGGNTLIDGGFVPSQGGPVCTLAEPLDPDIVARFIETDPERLSYDREADTVHCRHCWGAVIGGSA